jgi:hypothetical protein
MKYSNGVLVICVGCAWRGLSAKCNLGKSDGKNSWKLTCPECGEDVWVEEFLEKTVQAEIVPPKKESKP